MRPAQLRRCRLLPVLLLCLLACGGPATAPAPATAVRALEGFPSDSLRRHDRDFVPSGELRTLSDNLFLYRDCSNVYIVRQGDRALLVDFGSGEVMGRLKELGIATVERVLATHHHRDQVQGLCELDSLPFPVTVPTAEARHFVAAEEFWRTVQLDINYDCRSHWNTIRRSIPVDRQVSGGDSFDWQGIEFRVIDTPGSSQGAVSYAATIDGRRVVFSGDLIAGAGLVNNWFDLHWDYYGFTQGIEASEGSFERVLAEEPALLLPAHGEPVERPREAVEANRQVYAKLRGMLIPNELHRQADSVRQVLPHLWFIGGTSWAITSDSGEAFIYDYGYVDLQRLWDFKGKAGVRRISAVSFSHYHDDHNYRVYELLHGDVPERWIYRNMLEVFEHPERFRLPCLLPFPIRADRVLHDGETIRWNEYELQFCYLPGQTEYHQGLMATIDGRKVMFTGDNTWNKLHPDQPRNGPLVPQNIYQLDGGFIICAEKMLEYGPDLVCPAHTEEYAPSRADLEEFRGWALELREVMTGLIAQPDPGFGMDYQWCRLYPYRQEVRPGETFRVELRLRNHLWRPATVRVRLRYPESLACGEPLQEFMVGPRQQVAVPFILQRLEGAPGGREVLTADLTINGRRVGEYAECLVDTPREDEL